MRPATGPFGKVALQAEALEQFLDLLLGQVVLGSETSLIAIVRIQIISKVVCVTLEADLPHNVRHRGCGHTFTGQRCADQADDYRQTD